MAYTERVQFPRSGKTANYGCDLAWDEEDVYTVAEFIECCEVNAFIDYDGFGHPVKDGFADPKVFVSPSKRNEIPKDATHIVWYNK